MPPLQYIREAYCTRDTALAVQIQYYALVADIYCEFSATRFRLQGTDEGEGCDVSGQSRDQAQNDQIPWLRRVQDLGLS